MKKQEFLAEIARLTESLKANIEADCAGWSDDADAITARLAAVTDTVEGFGYFVANYFPHYIRNTHKSDLHKYLYEILPAVLDTPKSCLEAIAAPRGEGKSVLVSQLFVLYCIVTGKKKYVVIVMDSIDQAYPMLAAIKAELEANPRLKIDFPHACGTGKVWKEGTIVTKNNIKVQIAGSGKKLRGLRHGAYRPDLVILDDIENDEQVRNPVQRDKLHNWLTKTVLPLGAAGEKLDIVYIGTILHYDSVLSRTLSNPAWRTARFKALVKLPHNMQLWDEWEEIYRNQGEPKADRFYAEHRQEMDAGAIVSWKARPLLVLMKIRARDGHSTFDSEYQNDPVSSENAQFKGIIQYWADLPHDLIYFGAVDPSLGKHGKSRDPSAILIGGYDRQTGKLYVVEAAIKKRLPDRIISDVITLQKRYNCKVWFVEAVQFQEFLRTELVKRGGEQGVPIPARAVTPHTDKMLRIETLQPHVGNGMILFHSSQSTLISQLEHFPMADHDDGPDCLHQLWAGAVANSAPIEWTSLNKEGYSDYCDYSVDDDGESYQDWLDRPRGPLTGWLL